MTLDKALQTLWNKYRPGVEAVVAFANMKIESALQVDRALSRAATQMQGVKIDGVRVAKVGSNTSMQFTLNEGIWHPWDSGIDPTPETYRSDQKTLQRWLNKMSNWNKLRPKEKETILKEMKPWIEHPNARVVAQIQGDRLYRSIAYDASSVRRAIGEAIYLLFEWGFHEGGGIGMCSQCKDYFVKDRSDKETCSNRCRQRRFREKKKSK